MLSICTLFATYLCQFCQLMPENYYPKDKPKESNDDDEEEKEEVSFYVITEFLFIHIANQLG